jgi:ethanolamine kinase
MLAYALRYPSKAQREAFCAVYLAALPATASSASPSTAAADAAALAAAADEHALASHLLWGFWGVIQERASSVDFDFLGYAAARFDEAITHAARLEAEAR